MAQKSLLLKCTLTQLYCLNFIAGSTIINPFYNRYYRFYQPWHIYHINCIGTESTLWDCQRNTQINTCNQHYYAAALSCSGEYTEHNHNNSGT